MTTRSNGIRILVLCMAAVALWLGANLSQAGSRCVDLALVLAIDGSSSVDDGEFELQRRGIANALRDPDVLAAIAQAGQVSMAAIFWGGGEMPVQTIGWQAVSTAGDGDLLARHIESLPRNIFGSTGLGNGLAAALDMIAKADFCAHRTVINVSGDGRETVYHRKVRNLPLPEESRNRAERSGVTINALVIGNQEDGLANYFAKKVITGPGAFVIDVKGYESYAQAMRRKLIREIGPVNMSGL